MKDTVTQSRSSRTPGALDKNAGLGWFMVAVGVVGAARFQLTVAGVPDSTARWSSMTAVLFAAILFYGPRARTHRMRWLVAYGLILPYMLVESAALGFSWASGTDTIFHSPAYSLGTPLPLHFFGHVVGGLTWEPAMVWAALWVVGTVAQRVFPQDSV